jgi:hypothetical protein
MVPLGEQSETVEALLQVCEVIGDRQVRRARHLREDRDDDRVDLDVGAVHLYVIVSEGCGKVMKVWLIVEPVTLTISGSASMLRKRLPSMSILTGASIGTQYSTSSVRGIPSASV